MLREPGETTVTITVGASNIECRGVGVGGGGVPERVPMPMAAYHVSGKSGISVCTTQCSNPEHTVNSLQCETLKLRYIFRLTL